MKTEELIRGLSKDAAPVTRLPPPVARLALWLPAALAAAAAGAAVFGCRADQRAALSDGAFRGAGRASLAHGAAGRARPSGVERRARCPRRRLRRGLGHGLHLRQRLR